LQKRSASPELFTEGKAAFEAYKSLNYEFGQLNFKLKQEKDKEAKKQLKAQSAELKKCLVDLNEKMVAALSRMPNILHAEVMETAQVLEEVPIQFESFDGLQAFLSAHQRLQNHKTVLPTDKMFTVTDLPLYALEGVQLTSVVAPDEGWMEQERHLELLKDFFAAVQEGGSRRMMRFVLCSGKETAFDAAKQVDVWLDEEKIASVFSFSDFKARKDKMRLAKSNQMSKSINNYGYVWTVSTVFHCV
jgi:seryl-tRNA synthetase